MRWVIGLAILAGVVYWKGQLSAQVEYSGIPAYSEFRLQFEVPGREIEMVGFVEFDAAESCQVADRMLTEDGLNCEATGKCRVVARTCLDTIPEGYKKLFERQPIDTTYMSLEKADNRRKFVTVVWGTTQEEGRSVCQQMLSTTMQGLSERKITGVNGRCIVPSEGR